MGVGRAGDHDAYLKCTDIKRIRLYETQLEVPTKILAIVDRAQIMQIQDSAVRLVVLSTVFKAAEYRPSAGSRIAIIKNSLVKSKGNLRNKFTVSIPLKRDHLSHNHF